jgi:hypothetical protein
MECSWMEHMDDDDVQCQWLHALLVEGCTTVLPTAGSCCGELFCVNNDTNDSLHVRRGGLLGVDVWETLMEVIMCTM